MPARIAPALSTSIDLLGIACAAVAVSAKALSVDLLDNKRHKSGALIQYRQ